jgi:hypothetical protein
MKSRPRIGFLEAAKFLGYVGCLYLIALRALQVYLPHYAETSGGASILTRSIAQPRATYLTSFRHGFPMGAGVVMNGWH